MRKQIGDRPTGRGRLPVLAALAVAGAVIAALAVGAGGLRLWNSAPSAESSAQERCQSEVMNRLASPATANLSDVHTETSSLDLDARDLFAVTTSEPLKDIDAARITVLNVSGVVNAQNEFGSTIQDRFDCRAYFVDGSLAHTLVLFDHAH
ncbi:MAG: hypothetical protein AB7G47_14860 [Mycolicibacterium sp.]|uniref:hypothetical protein n=1 Tax=Mycolicibacterium sp. TaxID=2320850 RepID=UPI003D09C1A9